MKTNWLESEVVYFCRQRPLHTQNGGHRRSAQLTSCLADIDMAVVCAADYDGSPKVKIATKLATKLGDVAPKLLSLFDRHAYGWAPATRNYFLYLNSISCYWKNLLKSSTANLKVAIVDDPVFFAPIVEYLSNNGIRVIAFCHNIETLSRPQVQESRQTALLKYEIELLRKCCLAVTISYEECFLLTNLGIPAYFLPYFPVKPIQERMSAIRAIRNTSKKAGYLLLGTVWNPPTLQGMQTILNNWHPPNIAEENTLIVAGFGIEQLMPNFRERHHIVFRGAMPDGELDNVLATCKGAIIYQDYGAGALTKICEYLLAGVPVFVNSHAARSYHNLPGVIEYSSFRTLTEVLSTALDMETDEVFMPESPDPSPIIHKIKEFL